MDRAHYIAVCLVLGLGASAEAEKAPRSAAEMRAAAEHPRRAMASDDGQRPNAGLKGKRSEGDGIGNAAGSPLARWNQLSPEQREKRLQKLPPERRQQIRERLERFNSLPPEERDRLQRRYDRFSNLPPAKQDLVRRQIQNFSQLTPDRRPEVSREFDQLRRMTPEERAARLKSDDFKTRFQPREREILSDLSENLAIPPVQP